jgi:hypothetical protein
MAASEVTICNLAVSWLAGNLIISLDDDNNEAKLCKANYDLSRDSVLEAMAWTFATRRFRLSPEADVPAWGYSRQFTLPPEVITALEVTSNPSKVNGTNDLDWRREENRIVCNQDVVYLKAIVRIIDPARFTPNFVQALAARIAMEIAVPLTESKELLAAMERKYLAYLYTASATDGLQGKSDLIDSQALTGVRGGSFT